jgi:acetate kinase
MNYDDPRDYKAKQVSEFLKKMSAIESSSGTDTDHRQIKEGIHKGTAAVGDYGIMPNTALEMGNRYNIPELQGLNPEEAQALLSQNPELAERVAASMASGLLDKTDEETANYMWQYGHNKIPEQEKVKKSPRTRKFKILNKNVKE